MLIFKDFHELFCDLQTSLDIAGSLWSWDG
jgi:hypothetical protein